MISSALQNANAINEFIDAKMLIEFKAQAALEEEMFSLRNPPEKRMLEKPFEYQKFKLTPKKSPVHKPIFSLCLKYTKNRSVLKNTRKREKRHERVEGTRFQGQEKRERWVDVEYNLYANIFRFCFVRSLWPIVGSAENEVEDEDEEEE